MQQQIYESWKQRTLLLKKHLGDGQCVSLIINNSNAYLEAAFPGVSWTDIIRPVASAKDLPGAANPKYLQWIPNDHNNPNQVPEVGDIMVFDKTPAVNPATGKATTNQFNNPDGHDGVADGNISGNGFDLFQQNAPASGEAPNVTHYDWNFRLCLGWFRLMLPSQSAPAQVITASAPVQQATITLQHTVTLPATTGPWHLYREGSSYNPNDRSAVIGIIDPRAFHRDLEYPILKDLGNGKYLIPSEDYGNGVLWTAGSDVVIR